MVWQIAVAAVAILTLAIFGVGPVAFYNDLNHGYQKIVHKVDPPVLAAWNQTQSVGSQIRGAIHSAT